MVEIFLVFFILNKYVSFNDLIKMFPIGLALNI